MSLRSGRQRVGFVADLTYSAYFSYTIPIDDTGVQAILWVSEADPDLFVSVPNGVLKSSEGYYLANETVTVSAGDGAVPGARATVRIDCLEPTDYYQARTIPGVSVLDTGRCAGVLEVFSFADLQNAYLRPIVVPQANTTRSGNGSVVSMPSVRYFRFLPPEGSSGVSLALSLNPGADPSVVDMFVSLYAKDGWPVPGEGRWSTASQSPQFGDQACCQDVGKTVQILDTEYVVSND